ncbi:MAG: tRNA (adenosine(37)-N6)-dimethylallyltransferase MiaA, partial [Proteobacteria bacterium]
MGNLELRPVVIVSGPTACGKSELACEIAAALQGEVINLDSVQIYSGLNIGSAKPEPQV